MLVEGLGVGVTGGVSRPLICKRESIACIRTGNPVDSRGINLAKVNVREVCQGQITQNLTEHVLDHRSWEPSCILFSASFPKLPSVSQTTLKSYDLCLTNNQLSSFLLRQS